MSDNGSDALAAWWFTIKESPARGRATLYLFISSYFYCSEWSKTNMPTLCGR